MLLENKNTLYLVRKILNNSGLNRATSKQNENHLQENLGDFYKRENAESQKDANGAAQI